MTLKGDAIKEKLTGGFKNDIRNLVNFRENSRKSENLHFHGLILSIAYKLKRKRRVELKSDPNFEEKRSVYLKNDMRNLVNFNTSIGKSENLYFDGLLLSKVCNV